jgi:prepilin-type N-terminal cleavage/methylation domain-containing protein
MTLAIGRNKGFTLVEVIISIGILSFGLILVLQGFAQSLNAINISHKNLHASLLADEMIAQYLIDSDNAESVSLDSKNGKIEFENAVYDWGIETKQDEEQAE